MALFIRRSSEEERLLTLALLDGYWSFGIEGRLYPGGSPSDVIDSSKSLTFCANLSNRIRETLVSHLPGVESNLIVAVLHPTSFPFRADGNLTALKYEVSSDSGIRDKGRLVYVVVADKRDWGFTEVLAQREFCGIRSRYQHEFEDYGAFSREANGMLLQLQNLGNQLRDKIPGYFEGRGVQALLS